MYQNYFGIFDLETGGLKTKGECSPITEFAISILDNNLEPVEEHDFFIKPYEPEEMYSPDALKVSNITLDLCQREGLEALEAAKKIGTILKNAKAPSQGKKLVLVGHNIDSFDIPLLDYFLSKHKIDLGKLVETNFTIDTKWWGRMAYPELPGYTLSDCLMKELIDNEQAHRAIGDVRANAELFKKMMSRLRGSGILVPNSEVTEEDFRKNFRFQMKRR